MNLEIENKVNSLKKKINEANRLYYEEDRPQISDYEYDHLLKELNELEEK